MNWLNGKKDMEYQTAVKDYEQIVLQHGLDENMKEKENFLDKN